MDIRRIKLPVAPVVLVALCLLGIAPLTPILALAQTQAQAQTQTQNSRAQDIRAAEKFLNALTTLKARFYQVSTTGEVAEGYIYLSRLTPGNGKMRIDYDSPPPIQLFANHGSLAYYDKELEQLSYISLGDVPAGFLLNPRIALDTEETSVNAHSHVRGIISLSLIHKDNPDMGAITLDFNAKPFALRQWRVMDGQGVETTFALHNPRYGIHLDDDLFAFPKVKTAIEKLRNQ